MNAFRISRQKIALPMLSICGIVLLSICCLSVISPIRFERERGEREKAVISRLLTIRKAEERYLQKHGTYCGNFATLIKRGFLKKEEQYIPFNEDGKRFALQATMQVSKSGRQIPLMECSAAYEDYLQGLDENAIINLTEQANSTGRFPGLKIGDITEANNNAGNW
jgi:hypothetical protein